MDFVTITRFLRTIEAVARCKTEAKEYLRPSVDMLTMSKLRKPGHVPLDCGILKPLMSSTIETVSVKKDFGIAHAPPLETWRSGVWLSCKTSARGQEASTPRDAYPNGGSSNGSV